jgi:hypothetical protein
MQRSTSSTGSGALLDAQDWVFQAASGEHLELHIKYEHGVGNQGAAADVKFYSAKNPVGAQLSRQEQVLDILRNATTNPPDRVKEFSFKGSGGSYAKLFDGTERVLSWDNIVWLNRSVMQPWKMCVDQSVVRFERSCEGVIAMIGWSGTRREFGQITLGGLAAAMAGTRLLAIDSTIGGVKVGAISYCFRSIPRPANGDYMDTLIDAFKQVGLGICELESVARRTGAWHSRAAAACRRPSRPNTRSVAKRFVSGG